MLVTFQLNCCFVFLGILNCYVVSSISYYICDNNITGDINSVIVKKQMEEWAAKGLVVIEEAQREDEVQNTFKV